MTPLTEQQKLEKAKRNQLQKTVNRLKSEFAFKKLKTYHDFLRSIGREPTGEDYVLTFETLKALTAKLQDEFEAELKKSHEVKQTVSDFSEKIVVTNAAAVPTNEPSIDASKDYKLAPSPREKVTLFWFQKKAAKELLNGLGL